MFSLVYKNIIVNHLNHATLKLVKKFRDLLCGPVDSNVRKGDVNAFSLLLCSSLFFSVIYSSRLPSLVQKQTHKNCRDLFFW